MKALVIVFLTALLVLLCSFSKNKKLGITIAIVGLLVSLGCTIFDYSQAEAYNLYDMLLFDKTALLYIALALLCGTMVVSLSTEGLKFVNERIDDHIGLLLFSICGAICMISASNMVMLFLGIEILSIPLYVLAGSKRNDLSSNESALKYFLMGAFATGIFLYGVALVYGASGHFDFIGIKSAFDAAIDKREGIGLVGVLLIAVGLLFKVSAAPFHFWSPDVYEGSPNAVTTYMASVVKVAGFSAIVKLFLGLFISLQYYWLPIIAVVSAFSMLMANIIALQQVNVKRLLAYSSISHAGYMLMHLLSGNGNIELNIIFYLFAYSLASITVFAVFTEVNNASGMGLIENFKGLAKHHPMIAFCLAVALLSMSGIPPFAGFFGKYLLFSNAFATTPWVLVVAVLSSAISIYYYFKIIQVMYFEHGESVVTDFKPSTKFVCLVAVIGLIAGTALLRILG